MYRLFCSRYVIVFFLGFSMNAMAQSNLDYDTTIRVGAELKSEYLPLLKDKRIAIVGNQTSVVNGIHLVDVLLQEGVNVKKVFSPEHGFRGKADAGEKINTGLDAKTGLPLVSLYGKRKKPTKEDLYDVDVVVFDIQDVGARFYTYISTMHYVMEACAEQDKEFVVFDRPNPNGFYVDGPILKEGNESFIGVHPIPIVHGMTIGEYAQMINGEKWLKDGIQCKTTVIKCENYEHTDYYKLPVKPSPNLPNMASIYLYPSLCLFEGTNVSVGRGTDKQFQVIGAPYFTEGTYKFTPVPMEGAKRPKHKDVECNGFDLSDFGEKYMRDNKALYLPWIVGLYSDCKDKDDFFRKDGFFRLLTGDRGVRKMIEAGKTAEEISSSWQADVIEFKKVRSKYLLYEDFE